MKISKIEELSERREGSAGVARRLLWRERIGLLQSRERCEAREKRQMHSN